MSEPANAPVPSTPLGIVCGGGSLPFAVADAAVRRGRRVVLFALRGWADPERVAAYPHHWLRIGQLARGMRLAAKEQCRDVTFIGSVVRPSLLSLRPDLMSIRLFIDLFRGGDNRLQSGLGHLLERQGFHVLAPHEIAPELKMPRGAISAARPAETDNRAIAIGLKLLAATSPFDIGQAVVVADQHVLAVEGPEGTDQMLRRVAELRRNGRVKRRAGTGVLIKAPKIGQDSRIDLPTIGPGTIERAAEAELAGVAVVAGTTLVAEPEQVISMADRAGLFVVGVDADGWP